MKKLPILTIWLLAVVVLGAWHRAQAWPQNADATDTPAETSAVAAEPPAAPESAEQATEILRQVRETLFGHESIKAQLTQTVSLGDYRFRSNGEFVSASGFRFKLEYQLELAHLRGTFLEVCDGQMLHTQRTLQELPAEPGGRPGEPETEVSRRDVQRILKETRQHLDQPVALQAAELGLGGLPAVVASLERCMIFDTVREEQLGGQPVLTLEGKWNPQRRSELLAGLGPMANGIGGFMPDLVRLAIDGQTRFPLRIQYLKQIDPDKSSYQPMLTLAFSNIRFDEPVGFETFTYLPPQGLEEQDETARFIQMIQAAAAAPAGAGESTGGPVSPAN
ncbi:MAG: hypothetical protein KDA58_11815 [Planctomycetaceae bacterium]|nr:hypothetical protein [Planctomycetaceae bacterium]